MQSRNADVRHKLVSNNLPHSFEHIWFWVRDCLCSELMQANPDVKRIGTIKKGVAGPIHLHCTAQADRAIMQCFRMSLLFHEHGASILLS